MAANLLVEALVLLVFLAAAAFFSVAETAMIGVQRAEVRRRAAAGDSRAALVDEMLDDPERVLSTVLIGNNLVNIGATAYATTVALNLFGAEGALIATGAMAVLIILFSELLPKTLAVQRSLAYSLALARPLRWAERAMMPLVWGATWFSRQAGRLMGVKSTAKAPFITQDEIEMMVRMGAESGQVGRFEERVITEVLDFAGKPISRVLTPAHRLLAVPPSAMLAQAAAMAAKHGRSRILVAAGSEVQGFVHIKDLLHYADDDLQRLPVTLVLRPCLTVTPDTKAHEVLQRMQKEHRGVAIVKKGGSLVGIVTADDLVEELVGEIHDEFDAARRPTPTAA